ncbi:MULTISPECIES: phage tail assembly chaperone [unclassified Pseudomonas]|uniref:phage tail assembly chaperone n=1 Tax=unclassified Pseudomonas TaxID=196821 RepID=UPI000BC9113C|nr:MULTISPECIES: phage tail assembly chaperone [unclassified Pseudomonas]PVZ19922.1 tail assembly chaperone [Pseudomonas sp. URIL14HWK12:I12]PVZ26988.1 tail assembly chaperone [Pseudomonas sp. URIL14HWK12:I10]PVZ37877.1 tail assembly chaperone [Pseudomonas sp. URIL14HWK12:I11]SNZ05310.1 Phage tail assembly chaperone [Pseudomonas sp. URIL14HWK12:I9]
MAKIKIAPAPTFGATVQIPRVGGESLAVGFTFKYLDRLALAAFIDQQQADAQVLVEGVDKRTVVEQAQAEIDVQVKNMLTVVDQWDFEDALGEDSLRALATTFAGAPEAVMSAYFQAYREARLGN